MTVSYRVIELVKRRISNEFLKASDNDAAKALGLSRTSVSHYKHGRDVMSQETLHKANEILELPENQLLALSLDLQIEGAKNDNTRGVFTSLREMLRAVEGKKIASILLASCAMLAHVDDASALGNKGFSAHSPAGANFPGMYIMVSRVRTWLRRLAARFTAPAGDLVAA